MALKSQNLERNGIENETFECILITAHVLIKHFFLQALKRVLEGYRNVGVLFFMYSRASQQERSQ